MKLADLANPVRASWLADQGSRLDPGPYVSDTYAARMFLKRLPATDRLADVTDRMFHPGRVTRNWTHSREHGVPFIGSADIFEADLSYLPRITRSSADSNPKLFLEPGWTLITRSGMTAGRVTYARHEMKGSACSEDVLRVVANERIPAGYLYAFLASPYGTAMIKGGIYGTSVKHIEPPHLADIPVPRLGDELEQRIHDLIWKAMDLRSQFQEAVVNATQDLFESAGLQDLASYSWHDEPRDLGFVVNGLNSTSLRALNFSPRAHRIMDRLKSVHYRTLGEVCQNGRLERGERFVRRDTDSENGYQLIGQRQGFWMRPEGRIVALKKAELNKTRVADETILISTIGSAGEGTVYCRPVFITGRWQRGFVFSEAFLQVGSGDKRFPGSYLFALLRSEPIFRILRSMSYGSLQQYIHEELRRQIPVPECTAEDRERIAEAVRQAYRWRDEADVLEDEAWALLDEAVREAAR